MAISERAPTDQRVIAEVKDIRAELGSLNETSAIVHGFALNRCYKDGAWTTAVDAAPGSSLLGLAGTVGSPLLGNAASANSKSDYAGFSFTLPPNYVPGGAITVRVRAKIADSLATASSKVDLECKLVGDTLGSDICATAAQQVTTSYAYYDFTITPTGLVPGNVLAFRVATLNDDTGGTNNKAMSITKIDVWPVCYLGKIGADVVAS